MDYGLIVDTETTGLEVAKDHLLEIGLLEFCVEGDAPPKITRMYGALRDPGEGVEIPPVVEKLTGISLSMVRGQAIDWDVVRSFFERASVVVAHNADFDRRFLEATGELKGLKPHWACSLRHIDWRRHGFGSLSLNYLAADSGFLNPFAHRALFDCATTFRLVAPHIKELIARSYEREFLVLATSSPFESKDVLRGRGYRWAADIRVWSKVLPESALAEERTWLSAEVYKGQPRHEERPMDSQL